MEIDNNYTIFVINFRHLCYYKKLNFFLKLMADKFKVKVIPAIIEIDANEISK